ncbi:FAD-dependent monooxygenase [Streptomyces cocklensis]|uniref:2-polyprenyl-6-methoxyphenol hydroxylase n=1 Tax=Actinacidiphila cocklensis TaxID=887465 RepID=A0A9W4GVL8_9ACTN|nr:FAD-dependent monooxygenase [Actinacidiphila cocklensis]MDD1057709.1 FAD-dependent monooxygenase [Actinacidiphila cocklensis]WSX78785.1 FAD-dependent monooxygenase [Streptomyces sp. NBC_00899]CAG6398411.1 2-polyprenyl-6-methoxyphenol hydroxylase [Actinacidiphila cocklensis]
MHALVIGGGVAGPATAVALRAIGVEVTICEARPAEDKDVGLWVMVAPNGLAALEALDLKEAVLRESLTGAVGPSGFAPIRRVGLYRVLREAAVARGARIAHDRRLVAADTAPGGGVVARFSDGTALEGDLLVGCDGIHSRTRSVIDPAAPDTRYVPLLNLGGFTSGVDAPGEPAQLQFVRGRKGFFGYAASGRGEVWWFANLPWGAEPTRAELAEMDRTVLTERLLDTFAEAPPYVADLIRGTYTDLYALPTHDLPTVPTWWRGDMVILGDAAHATTPTSGQGSSMALEDAVVLAKCLRDLPRAQAPARYEQLRRERVEGIVALGARASAAKLNDALPDNSLDWVLDYRIDWAARV